MIWKEKLEQYQSSLAKKDALATQKYAKQEHLKDLEAKMALEVADKTLEDGKKAFTNQAQRDAETKRRLGINPEYVEEREMLKQVESDLREAERESHILEIELKFMLAELRIKARDQVIING